ncbi:MAG TPA: transglycosylase domain-containing protein, partial [Erysipelotrichaceae bacterium]|nr:transglycosylase domain-containing protein [Erysipelotrichaceae bacterium]
MNDNKNNDNNNLDETKVFSTIDDKKESQKPRSLEDTMDFDIPFAKKVNNNLEETITISEEELIDEGLSNIKAAEAEIEEILKTQNGSSGGDDMGKKNKKKKEKRISGLGKFNIFLLILVFFMIAGFGAAFTIWNDLSKGTPELNMTALANEESTILLDSEGEEFFDLSVAKGPSSEDLEYIDMSQNVIDAFVSIEDSRFFKHIGFDIPRFTKALLENIKDRRFSQGGSTLTMQLIKTSHLSAEKALTRKAEEINLALELEERLSKEKIFEYYVNKINYGAGNTRGLEGASLFYFNKNASELSLSEAALLAGVVNRPNAFDPINNLDSAYKRRDTVLELMNYHGYIDDEEEALAKATKIENQLTDEGRANLSIEDSPYIDYVNAVIDEIQSRLDIDIVSTPLIVHTHLDRAVQEDVAAIQRSEGYQYPDDHMQSAVAIGDNETGALIALGAGRDSQVVKGRNRATRMFQQPGSVTKPLLSYALAFEHLGWATSHVVEDRPIQYAGTDKILGNFNNRYVGEMTLKEAISRSINTPAYQTLLEVEQEISRYAVADYLHDSLGFSKVNRENYNTQYAIGGSTFSVSPAELFGAQAVMMNGGFYTKPHTVRYVETMDNEIIKEEFEYPKTKVISEETAYLVSVLEAYNVTSGYVNRMEILGGRPYEVYAKTGTTDYADTALHLGIPEGAGKDQWMFASSKDYTSVVWMGWDKPEADKGTYWSGYKYSMNPLGKMNQRLLTTIHKDKENPGRVTRPAGVASITHVLSTFPYANPIEGMDSQYVTTGEINKKYLNLVDLDKSSIDIEVVEDFTANITADKKDKIVTLNWSEYPEDGEIKSKTYDISLGRIKATGTRLFHPSWIFGPVQYKATIYVDGEKLEEVSSDENTFQQSFKIPNDATVKICGYYGNSEQNGSETCLTVDNPIANENIRIPKFDLKQEIE